ncbi:hypothetical protein DSO57_1000448 [Entomophthora muscae]|uniref:Uncharacterized protein n=1 Tax=Entomophthora muscae TaxID=34485 RepID=A0ACC2UVT3_9FUNG|nr:hypothetical protein DSO57_1000448 [Entomophthora muscae]
MSKILNVGSASAGNFTLKAKRGKTILYVECCKEDKVKILKERLCEMLKFSLKDSAPTDMQLFKEAVKASDSDPTHENMTSSDVSYEPLKESAGLETYGFKDGSTIFMSFFIKGAFEGVHFEVPVLPAPESDASDDEIEKSTSKATE